MARSEYTSPDHGFWDTLVVLALAEEGLLTQNVEPSLPEKRQDSELVIEGPVNISPRPGV